MRAVICLCVTHGENDFSDIDLLNNFGPIIHYVRRGGGVSDQAYENAVRLYRRISIIAIDRRRRRRGKSTETTAMGSDPFSITITGKSRFKKPHFFFLKSRVVWFKKDLCTESENRSAEKMTYLQVEICFERNCRNILLSSRSSMKIRMLLENLLWHLCENPARTTSPLESLFSSIDWIWCCTNDFVVVTDESRSISQTTYIHGEQCGALLICCCGLRWRFPSLPW